MLVRFFSQHFNNIMLVVLLITETFVNTYKLFLHFIDDSHVIYKLATIRDVRKKQLKVANRANLILPYFLSSENAISKLVAIKCF